MAIYFPNGNGGRKRVDGVIGGENFSLADLKLTGFSEVADATGEITDGDNLLVALAKCWNRRPASATRVRTPSQQVALTYNGLKQSPVWNGFNSEQLSIVSGNEETNAGIYTTTFALKKGFEWEDGTTGNKGVQWKIERAAITNVPSQSNTLFYDGTPKAPAWRNYSANQLTIDGTTSATEAGTYNATFTPTANYRWEDGTITAKTVAWAIGRSVADTVPKVASTLRYTGAVQSPTWNNYDSARLDIGGTTSATKVGSYVATFTPKNGVVWADGKSDTKSVEWTIERATIAIPTVTGTTFTYNGNNQAPVVSSYDDSLVVVTGNAPQVNAGNYSVVCAIKDKANYQWTDGTIVDISTPWTIRKVSVAVPTITTTTFTYDGVAHAPTISSYDTKAIAVTGNEAQTSIGSYTTVFALKDTANYQWTDGTITDISTSWTIRKVSLPVPSVTNTRFTYDGNEQSPTIEAYDTNLISVTGNTPQIGIGTYTITFALKNTTNCQWENGSTLNQTVTWEIVDPYPDFYNRVNMLQFNTMRFGTDCFIIPDD